jgi:ubiquinone/menaquinone biosynthesis C-methylase UbiE
MYEKHYNLDYLSETLKLLSGVKQKSYTYFNSIPEGGTIVDLGCGSGQDVLNMSRMFDTNKFEFIGIDHDPEMIAAGQSAIQDESNVKFLMSNVLEVPLSEAAVDGIRMERLVQHIAEPLKLFKETHRLLKDDGLVVIVESDWNSLSFYNGENTTADKLNHYLSEQKVNNGRAAQSLTAYLSNTGFSQIAIEIFPFVLKSYDDACKYLWIDKMIDEMLSLNIIEATERDRFIESQKHADQFGYFSCSMNIVVVSAVK